MPKTYLTLFLILFCAGAYKYYLRSTMRERSENIERLRYIHEAEKEELDQRIKTLSQVKSERQKKKVSGTTSSVPPSKTSDQFQNQFLKERAKRLQELVQCAEEDRCHFELDDEDPRSFQFALSTALQRELKALLMEFRRTGEDRGEVEKVARFFVQYDDDYARDMSLEIFKEMSPSEENLDAILSGLRDSISGSLYQRGLGLLQSYRGKVDSGKINQFLSDSIMRGGHFSRDIVAKNILPYLDKKNLRQFQSVLKQLPPRDLRYRYLKANLREYQKMQSGG